MDAASPGTSPSSHQQRVMIEREAQPGQDRPAERRRIPNQFRIPPTSSCHRVDRDCSRFEESSGHDWFHRKVLSAIEVGDVETSREKSRCSRSRRRLRGLRGRSARVAPASIPRASRDAPMPLRRCHLERRDDGLRERRSGDGVEDVRIAEGNARAKRPSPPTEVRPRRAIYQRRSS